jgi:hypothetical protein
MMNLPTMLFNIIHFFADKTHDAIAYGNALIHRRETIGQSIELAILAFEAFANIMFKTR